MSLSKIESASIADNAVSASKLAPGAAVPSQTDQGGKFLTTDGSSASWATVVTGPSITSLTYPGDDTAVDTASPGQCVLIGTAFESGSLVYVDTVTPSNSATGISISGTTQITFTPPAKAAATYNLWVVGPSGRLTVFANGIQYSGTPSWSGQSTSLEANAASVSIQLTAAGDTPLVYSLISGTLPTGVTLSSAGLISGTATGLTGNTTFPNIVVKAQDPQNQDSSITITLDIIVQHQISRSLRFNSADSAYLSRTPASAGNRKTWTWSGWVKRSALTNNARLFCAQTDGSNRVEFMLNNDTDNFMRVELLSSSSNGDFVTNQLFRDVSAWYHIVLAVDTTQATNTNRVKIYVNGEQITSFSTATYPNQNIDYAVNNNVEHNIGRSIGYARHFSGYLAEVHFIDGQALTPSSFGGYDPNTGVWRPIGYTGAYGTNGFYLDFSDNSNTTATTLGADSSGNGNNWTPSGFSVASGAGNDSVVDSPTQYGTDTGAGGEVRGNYATLNPLSKLNWFSQSGSAITVANGNLEISSVGSGGNMIDATIAVTSGKWYWEVTFSSNTFAGIRSTRGIPTGDITYRLYTTGIITHCPYNSTSPTTLTTVASIASGDVVGIALDLDSNTIAWYKNGSLLYTATSIVVDEYTPCAGAAATSSGIVLNFGQREFSQTSPSGFKALCTTNLPDPTILQGDDHFNTVLYTGNGENPQSITGVGFQPDFVWIKDRSAAFNHVLVDAVRGVSRGLFSNSTSAEDYTANFYVTAFNSDGFSLYGSPRTNSNGVPHVAWNWKANGAGSLNEVGSIPSTVSANTTAGISIVTATKSAGASVAQTFGHGLGVAPAMIILKRRNGTEDWLVYHQSLGNNSRVQLNQTAAVISPTGVWDGTSPTSTVFTVRSFADGDFVAYCFAEVEGFSKFGSYTGNDNPDGPFVYTGFRPAFLMIKNSSATQSWVIIDATRSAYNVAANKLYPNAYDVENSTSTDNSLDILSNGFKLRGDAASNDATNGLSNIMIYAAFAEYPFKNALAR